MQKPTATDKARAKTAAVAHGAQENLHGVRERLQQPPQVASDEAAADHVGGHHTFGCFPHHVCSGSTYAMPQYCPTVLPRPLLSIVLHAPFATFLGCSLFWHAEGSRRALSCGRHEWLG